MMTTDEINNTEEVSSRELPPYLITNLIEWLKAKNISDSDIIDCIMYICTPRK